jgi:hypothetical protein
MGRTRRRRNDAGAFTFQITQQTSLSTAIRAAYSTYANLSVQIDVQSGGNQGNSNFRYVRIGAPAGGTGMSWASPFNAIPSTLQRGLTYYLADGTYPSRTFSTPPSGTTPITIKKATAADHGEDISGGWNESTMGSGMALFTGIVQFTTQWWVLDGTASTLWATSGYGIKVRNLGGNACIRFSAANITVKHTELQGNGGDNVAPGESNDSFRFDSGANNITISRCYAWDSGRCIFAATGVTSRDVLIEYTRTGYHEGTVGGEHGETASMWSSPGSGATIQRWTYRYNLITHCEGTGGLMWDGDDLKVYGNVFYREASNNGWAVGNGVIGAWSNNEYGFTNVKVFNNTFINCTTSDGSPNGGGPLGTIGSGTVSGNEAHNNIFMSGGPVSFSLFSSHSHNHYVNRSAPTDTSATTSAVDPFVNYTGFDFHLAVDMTAGQTLASPYDVDPDGVARATWDRGAFEKV